MLYNIIFLISLFGLTFFVLLLLIFPYLGFAFLWLILILIPFVIIFCLAVVAIRFLFELIEWIILGIIWILKLLWFWATGSEETKGTAVITKGNLRKGARVTTRKDKMGKKVTWSSKKEVLDQSGKKWTKVSDSGGGWDDWI
ncbi:hypothetical protein EG329_004893 [Mollisiaceae sp. DMI_Dod_QoI]|nr:hypothetical protein EG329_004893 [Helotiales sp. DMI_Dod_QoI]